MNETPTGFTPDGANNVPDQNQQYAGQYGQQQYGADSQYAGQYGQQQYGADSQYAGQYGQQQYGADSQYAGQYGQQQYGADNQYAGQYGQQQYGADSQYAGQYGQQQYGADSQYAGQYGQQQYGAGGMNSLGDTVYSQTVNMYGDQAHKPETPNKRKGIKIAIISIVAALVVIAAFVVVYLVFLKKTPQEIVESAMENTFKEAENDSLAGVVELEEFDLDNIDFQSRFKIDSLTGLDEFKDAEVEWNGKTAISDGKNNFALGGSLSMAGETASVEVKVVDNKIYFSSPELFTKTFLLDVDSIMSELGTSASGLGGTIDSESLKKIIEEDLAPATETFKKSVVYEKVGKEEFTNANGDKVKAEHYTITVTKQAISDYADAIVKCLSKYIDSNLSDDMLSEMGVSKDAIKQQIELAVPTAINMMFTDDIKINVYVDGDKIAHIDSDYTFGSTTMGAKLNVDFMGNDSATSDVKASLVLSAGGVDYISYNMAGSRKKSGDKTEKTIDYTLSLENGSEPQNIIGKNTFSYDKKSGEVSGNSEIEVNAESIAVNYSAILADINKGKSFSLNDMKMDVNVSGEQVISLSGEMKLGKNSEAITAPADGDVVDYSVLENDDATKYVNMDGLKAIAAAWSDILTSAADKFPSIGSNNYPVIDEDDTDDTDDTDANDNDATEEATTEADTETADYSKEVIKMGDKTIKVKDPAGYERSYASQYSISLNGNDGSDYVTYESMEGFDLAATIKFYKDYYANYEEDEYDKLEDVKDGTVKAKDGTEVSYLLVKRTVFESDVEEVIFMYPVGSDTVVCSVKYWDAPDKIDVQSLCSKFIGAMEIK